MTITAAEVNDGDTSNDATIALTFTSSKSTSDFVWADITVNNGTLGALTGSGTSYAATFTPTISAPCTIDVAADKFEGPNGNNNTAADQFNWTYDGTAPAGFSVGNVTTTGGTVVANYWNSTNSSIDIAFSPLLNDSSIEGGTLQLKVKNATSSYANLGSAYTIQNGDIGNNITRNVSAAVFEGVTGVFGEDEIITFNADITDAYGNGPTNGTASGTTLMIVETKPTMTIASTTSGVTNGSTTNDATIALTFTSSKGTSNFVHGDITVNNGTLGTLSGSGTSYTATFTPAGDGAYTIDVAADTFTEIAGNGNTAATQFVWTYDGTAPAFVSVAATDDTYKIGDNIDITVTWDDTVIVTGTPTLALSNSATATYLSGTSSAALVFRYTVASGNTDSTDLSVSSYSGIIKDAAGNSADGITVGSGDLGSVIVDANSPTGAISFEIGGTSVTPPFSQTMVSGNSGKVRILVTFSEAVKDSPDPQLTWSVTSGITGGGGSGYMSKNSSTEFRYDWTVPTGDGTVTMSLGVAQDLAGNVVVATPTSNASFIVDNTVPTYSAGEVTSGDTQNATLTFIENLAVTSLSAADFDIEYSNDSGTTYNYLHQGSVNTGADIELNGSIIDISLNTAVTSELWTLYATYTKSGTTNQNIKDLADNELASFTRSSMTNNTGTGE